MVNLKQAYVLLFYYFVYFKVNLDQEKTNQLGESSPNLIFVAVNLDPIVLEKRWTDGESWPNDFIVKVNRGEDLRWVGLRCPLTNALLGAISSWEWRQWNDLFSVRVHACTHGKSRTSRKVQDSWSLDLQCCELCLCPWAKFVLLTRVHQGCVGQVVGNITI